MPGRADDPVARVALCLMRTSVDGPQRDYYLGVRMAVLRDTAHGYRVCRLCGEPYLPGSRAHERPLRADQRRAARHVA